MSVLIIAFRLLCPVVVCGQGINYPGNGPVLNSGAGNARTDPDNLFMRNNVAGMTEIPIVGEDESGAPTGKEIRSRWRFMGEAQAVYVHYRRNYSPTGFPQEITSEARIANPSISGEITYTSASHRYALGIGINQIFGNQSKLKDPTSVLGAQAKFYDTKVASNDLAFGAAIRLSRKLSLGGTFILGRGFIDQKAPIQQLAALGVIKQSRLNVSDVGAPGVSIGVHYRLSNTVSFGLNFKTRRSYDLEGSLETVQPLVSPNGIQFLPLTLNVKVNLKLPSILETGIQVRLTNRLQIDADYRFYSYSSALRTVSIIESRSGATLLSQPINAKDVHLFIVGGVYSINNSTKLHFGSAYITNSIPARFFNPGIYNSGGGEISGGIGKRIYRTWLNIGLMGIFGRDRRIDLSENPSFSGLYKSHGFIVGVGLRY